MTIDSTTLVRGRPIMMCGTIGRTDEGIFGRVMVVDGGWITMATPGGSVLGAGLCWMALLNETAFERLRMYECIETTPYRGLLTQVEWSVPASDP